jgi:hypothetical protein
MESLPLFQVGTLSQFRTKKSLRSIQSSSIVAQGEGVFPSID